MRGINRLWRTGWDLKTGLGDSADKVGAGAASAKAEQTCTCPVCRSKLMVSSFTEFCPVCVFRGAEMEPLFSAVICACNLGLFREALHEVYIPRIQRGKTCFAANVLGVRGALLSVLVHFFEHGRWSSPFESAIEGQNLTAEDQLFILMQAALYLVVTRGQGSAEAQICYERAESLCHSLNRPLLLYSTLISQWRYSLVTEKLTATLQIAKRIYSLAQRENDPATIAGACSALAANHCYLGDDFEAARQYDSWR